MMGKHTADDHRLPGQPVALRRRLRLAQGKLQPVAAQPLHNLAVVGIVEIGDDAPCHHLADALHLLQILQSSLHQRIHRLEVARQQTGRRLPHKTDAQGEDHPLEGHLLRPLDAVHYLLRRLGARTVAIDLLHVDVVQVGHISY